MPVIHLRLPPLTDDTATIESQLLALTTEIIPAQGNRTDLALSKAVELLKQAGSGKGDILLLTDEIDFDRNRVLAEAVRNDGYRLSILGYRDTSRRTDNPWQTVAFLRINQDKL